MNHRRLAGHRELDIHHGGQRIVRHDDRVDRVARDEPIPSDDDGDRLAREADRVDCDRTMFGRWERRPDGHRREEFGDLRAGEDGFDAVHGLGGAGIDGTDACVRDVTPLEGDVLHADERDVVDVGGAALNEPRIFAALDAFANELG